MSEAKSGSNTALMRTTTVPAMLRNTVVVFGSERFLVKATGKEWAVDWMQVHEVRDGRIVRFREYTDTAAIAEAYA
ncbi:hypothetical protein CQ14_35510 [Bradyrhizobium lablabi]|uniref:SnoaL-like domain-containing protein n=2 Tax=Bradyrhizobium lablabi TaxID=722472 RepID=A0A0R3MR08_9BRAD|nr:hypothetical protein CQ14_35510 [Bradyrhizobium lablabi]